MRGFVVDEEEMEKEPRERKRMEPADNGKAWALAMTAGRQIKKEFGGRESDGGCSSLVCITGKRLDFLGRRQWPAESTAAHCESTERPLRVHWTPTVRGCRGAVIDPYEHPAPGTVQLNSAARRACSGRGRHSRS